MNTTVIGGVITAVLLFFIIWYILIGNSLVRLRNFKDEAWSGIDVQLKRRHDLIGSLVNSVKGTMLHEKELLTEITAFRSQASGIQNVSQTAAVESHISEAISKLFAMMENYPELKSNQTVLKLQDSLFELEDDLQKARRYYNGCVREFNNKIEMFPSSIVANTKRFTKADFFELTDMSEREVPAINFWKASQKCPFCNSNVPDNLATCPRCGAKQMLGNQ
ncbi:MAG: LemA family protein [Oxalobacter sp.]